MFTTYAETCFLYYYLLHIVYYTIYYNIQYIVYYLYYYSTIYYSIYSTIILYYIHIYIYILYYIHIVYYYLLYIVYLSLLSLQQFYLTTYSANEINSRFNYISLEIRMLLITLKQETSVTACDLYYYSFSVHMSLLSNGYLFTKKNVLTHNRNICIKNTE